MRVNLYVRWLFSLCFICTLTACNSGNTTSTPAEHLVFSVEPSNTIPAGATNGIISPSIQVQVVDANNNLIKTATNTITLTIANNPGSNLQLESIESVSGVPYTGLGLFSGLLSGVSSTQAINGVATFNNLGITQPGNGYTLKASAAGMSSITSSAFNVAFSTTGYNQTGTNDGFEIANLTAIGSNYQGYVTVYIAQAPNPISESAFAVWSQPGWTVNTPRHAIFDYSNTISSPNTPNGPLTEYVDESGYTWGYIAQTQNYDWPFNPSNYSSPMSSGWEAGQTASVIPAGVVKYNSINKNQLYIFSKLGVTNHLPVLRYYITDEWGNVYTMKSTNRNNTTESAIKASFLSATLPSGWTKSMGYLPQDLYGYPTYGESTNSMFSDFRDDADNAYTQIVWGSNGNSIAQQAGSPMPIYAATIGSRVNGSVFGNSYMYGSYGNDQFYPELGGNVINGNGGYNGVFYLGNSSQYVINKFGSLITVVGINGTNDSLSNIQYIQFSNESMIF